MLFPRTCSSQFHPSNGMMILKWLASLEWGEKTCQTMNQTSLWNYMNLLCPRPKVQQATGRLILVHIQRVDVGLFSPQLVASYWLSATPLLWWHKAKRGGTRTGADAHEFYAYPFSSWYIKCLVGFQIKWRIKCRIHIECRLECQNVCLVTCRIYAR